MLIHLAGFHWRTPGHIPVKTLGGHLLSQQGQEFKHCGYPRVVYAAREGDRLVGVVLTIKNTKKVAAIDVKSYRLSIQKLRDGQQLADFNFFVVDERSGKGLYSYYHNSCGVNSFNDFVMRRFADLRTRLLNQELKKLPGRATKKDRDALKKRYSIDMATGQMIRQEALPDLLAQLAKIKSFEFDAVSLLANQQWFRPLSGTVKSRKLTLRFVPKSDIQSLSQKIVAMVKGQGIKQGRIEGEDNDKVRQVIDLIDTPDSFGHYPFDDVAEDGMVDYAHIEKSPFLTTMGKIMNTHSVHFDPLP